MNCTAEAGSGQILYKVVDVYVRERLRFFRREFTERISAEVQMGERGVLRCTGMAVYLCCRQRPHK